MFIYDWLGESSPVTALWTRVILRILVSECEMKGNLKSSFVLSFVLSLGNILLPGRLACDLLIVFKSGCNTREDELQNNIKNAYTATFENNDASHTA